jgi:hypothetical protein
MIDALTKSLHQEIFRSPRDQRVRVEIVSTDPLTVELEQMAQLIVPIAHDFGFVPLSSGEQVKPLSSWKELRDQLEFWMARSQGGMTYLHVTGEASDGGMRFRPGADLRPRGIEPASLEYSKGPASSLASSPLN